MIHAEELARFDNDAVNEVGDAMDVVHPRHAARMRGGEVCHEPRDAERLEFRNGRGWSRSGIDRKLARAVCGGRREFECLGDRIRLDLAADATCNDVRALAGTDIKMGLGRRKLDDAPQVTKDWVEGVGVEVDLHPERLRDESTP